MIPLRTLTLDSISAITDDPRMRVQMACHLIRRELRAVRRGLAKRDDADSVDRDRDGAK